MIVQLWEWTVTREARSCPVGVAMKRDRAMTALADALAESGQSGRGTVGPVVLVNGVHSDAHYLRLPVTDIALFEQGRVWWERPSQRGTRRSWSVVTERSRKALCGM